MIMKTNVLYIVLLALLFTVPACQTTSDTGEPTDELAEETATDPSEGADDMVDKPGMTKSVIGTVTYLDLEGGFYGIIGEDGKKYLPLNLDEGFAEDDLKVRFTYERREGVMSIAMWGQAVNITSIERAQ